MKLRWALIRGALSRAPERVVLEQSYLLAVGRECDMSPRALPRVRCLSSGRHGTVIHDSPGLGDHGGLIRVLWDGNTGGVYAHPENLSVIAD